MLVREYLGLPLTWQKITPGNTVTAIARGVWEYKEYKIGYDSCDLVGGFLAGMVITGATSGAIGIIRSVEILSGTIAGGDEAGNIRFHSWNGIVFTNNEKIKVAADADVADINGAIPAPCVDDYPYKERFARTLRIVAETQAQRVAFGGNKVTLDQTTGIGIPIPAHGSILIEDINAIRNVNVVDAAAGSAGSSIIVGYF